VLWRALFLLPSISMTGCDLRLRASQATYKAVTHFTATRGVNFGALGSPTIR